MAPGWPRQKVRIQLHGHLSRNGLAEFHGEICQEVRKQAICHANAFVVGSLYGRAVAFYFAGVGLGLIRQMHNFPCNYAPVCWSHIMRPQQLWGQTLFLGTPTWTLPKIPLQFAAKMHSWKAAWESRWVKWHGVKKNVILVRWWYTVLMEPFSKGLLANSGNQWRHGYRTGKCLRVGTQDLLMRG